uniref:Uncharacterized protein n=1 Tax=Candidatus Kentrum sp. FW TaxID=2126338 RepID=A0A450RYB8_9GAMM|nr:MAG: hypothetical protein BECKFW1821A_GA0114235_100615 [Candidatus Kentron sp. FW]VFJ58204.1 MAG: hypothetical protein BECKFW1821B_GA0114236_10407 [Candidatus Kentron sp. FW]
MMRSYEAEVGADGKVRLQEPLTLHGRHRAVVIVLESLDSVDTQAQPTDDVRGWRRFVGIMRDTPHFNADPVAIQRAMRDEWD